MTILTPYLFDNWESPCLIKKESLIDYLVPDDLRKPLREKGMVMRFTRLHTWPSNPAEAAAIQEELRPRVKIIPLLQKPQRITAIDTDFSQITNRIYAAAVTMQISDGKQLERAVAQREAVFPYIPALRGFREGPAIIEVLFRLKVDTDLLIFPCHGIAHPHSFGMASHLALWFNIPSIGCARKILCGQFDLPPDRKGAFTPIYVNNIEKGYVLRTKEGVKPMFVSPGHLCSLQDALEIILAETREFRMPEPLRLAHLYAGKFLQADERKSAFKGKNYAADRGRPSDPSPRELKWK